MGHSRNIKGKPNQIETFFEDHLALLMGDRSIETTWTNSIPGVFKLAVSPLWVNLVLSINVRVKTFGNCQQLKSLHFGKQDVYFVFCHIIYTLYIH